MNRYKTAFYFQLALCFVQLFWFLGAVAEGNIFIMLLTSFLLIMFHRPWAKSAYVEWKKSQQQ